MSTILAVLLLAACGVAQIQGGSASSEAPAVVYAQPAVPPASAPEPPEAAVMEVRAYPVRGAGDCLALSGRRAVLGATAEGMAEGDGQGSLWTVELETGAQRPLNILADNGLIQDDGERFWWVEEGASVPVPGTPFGEAVQTGILGGRSAWDSRLLYNGHRGRDLWQITQLARGEGRLVWRESRRFKDGGNGPSIHNRLLAAEDDGQPRLLAEWDSRDVGYHQLRLHGRWLVWWESLYNEETALHVADLAEGREVMTAAAIGPRDADFDGTRLVWCTPAAYGDPHTLWTQALGETAPWPVDVLDGEAPEEIGRLGLVGGRVLYSLYRDDAGPGPVRLLDPGTGVLLYRSEADPRAVLPETPCGSLGLLFDLQNAAAALYSCDTGGTGTLLLFRPR